MTSPQQFGEELNAEIYRILRSVAFGLQQKIVEGTPIDTGRAKSSWNLSENEPNFDVTPPLRPTAEDLAYHLVSQETLDSSFNDLTAGQALVAAQSSQQAVGPTPKVIFIANGLDYIEDLEHGTSSQAPNGMVLVNTTEDEIQLLIDQAIADKTPF